MAFRNLIDHAFATASTDRLDIQPSASIGVGYHLPHHNDQRAEGLYVEIGSWGVEHNEPRRRVDIGVGRSGKVHFGKIRVDELDVEDADASELQAHAFELGVHITAHPRVTF